MFKKLAKLAILGIMTLNLCGCFLLLAGAAGGAGTAVWLSGKLTQEFHSPYQKTIDAAIKALDSLKLDIIKKTEEDTVTQLRSKYSDGSEMWIDIRKISQDSTKVEVRVGAVGGNKEAATKVLQTIQKYL